TAHAAPIPVVTSISHGYTPLRTLPAMVMRFGIVPIRFAFVPVAAVAWAGSPRMLRSCYGLNRLPYTACAIPWTEEAAPAMVAAAADVLTNHGGVYEWITPGPVDMLVNTPSPQP